MQEIRNSLEVRLSCTNPSIYGDKQTIPYKNEARLLITDLMMSILLQERRKLRVTTVMNHAMRYTLEIYQTSIVCCLFCPMINFIGDFQILLCSHTSFDTNRCKLLHVKQDCRVIVTCAKFCCYLMTRKTNMSSNWTYEWRVASEMGARPLTTKHLFSKCTAMLFKKYIHIYSCRFFVYPDVCSIGMLAISH